MKPRAGYFGHVGVMLAAVCLLGMALTAQEPKRFIDAIGKVKPIPLPPGGPAPRTADTHADLSGVWFSGKLGKTSAWSTEREEPIKEDPRPFQPWAGAKIKGMPRTEIQLTNPGVNCLPKGVPGVFLTNPHPTEILQLPGLFVQLVEADNNWRLVHTDGRPHQKDPDPLFYGDHEQPERRTARAVAPAGIRGEEVRGEGNQVPTRKLSTRRRRRGVQGPDAGAGRHRSQFLHARTPADVADFEARTGRRSRVRTSLLLAAFEVAAVAGVATPWMAVVADTGASVIVITNAFRLLRAD